MLTHFQKTLPTFPLKSQNQLKLLNIGTNPVTVKLPGNDPLNLAAAQVRPLNNNHGTKLCSKAWLPILNIVKTAPSSMPLCIYPYSVCTVSTTFCFVLQASDEYFTFETENISVSIENPQVTKTISLTMGLRQTLLIPSDFSDEWLLVSETHKMMKFLKWLIFG